MLKKPYEENNLENIVQNKINKTLNFYKIYFKQFDTLIMQYYITIDLLISMGDFS